MTRLLAIGGDGIGPAVTRTAVEAIQRVAPTVEIVEGTAGRRALTEHGDPIAPDTARRVAEGRVDGVLFGATETRPGEPSAALALRELADAHLSLRPARARRPEAGPCEVHVYRELTEGLYVQDEDGDDESATARRRITRAATERFARAALAHAPEQPTPVVAHKATILPGTDGLFLETTRAVADALDRPIESRLVDALLHDIARDPGGPWTVLAPNTYGDLISDAAAGLAGGLGLVPSLILGEGPPIAEPVHGTAPDIAGRSIANPTAALLSAALLLEALGHETPARSLETAVDATLARGDTLTPDAGGQASTQTFLQAVLAKLEVPA